jgi:hypothetical protein
MDSCNVCGRPLAVHVANRESLGLDRMDELGDDDFEFLGMYRTREWDTRDLFPQLCESCACCLDRALRKMKTEMEHQQLALSAFKTLNAERKNRLGTKG